MQLAHELTKLGSGRVLQSAQRHLRQSPFLRRPTTVPLDPESLSVAVEGEDFEAIRQRHAVQNPGIDWPKYFDLLKWMRVNPKRVRDLGLDWGFRKDLPPQSRRQTGGKPRPLFPSTGYFVNAA